jgi:NDP-sugar pyrophosphorylase family protein
LEHTSVGGGATIDVGSVVTDSTVGAGARVGPYRVITSSNVAANAQVGSLVHLPTDNEVAKGQTLALSLAPGEVSQPILLGFIPGGDTLLSIEPVPGDCDPVNDEVTFYAPFIDCK